MGTLANSDDTDEIPQSVTFHQGLHCLLKKEQSSRTKDHLNLEILTLDLLICTISHSRFILSYQMEEFINI